MVNEEEVRKRIKRLRQFYVDLINFLIVTVILTLIWYTFDTTGTFWPKYVILIWGILLVFKAYRMKLMYFIVPRSSFLTPDWEEKKVREILRKEAMHQKHNHHKTEKERQQSKDKNKNKKK